MSIPLRVAVFLHNNDEQAFTNSEMAGAVDADLPVVATSLARLEKADLVHNNGEGWTITEETDRFRLRAISTGQPNS